MPKKADNSGKSKAWTQNERERVLDYHDLGWSASEIAHEVGRTRNAVLGIIHRRKDIPPRDLEREVAQ